MNYNNFVLELKRLKLTVFFIRRYATNYLKILRTLFSMYSSDASIFAPILNGIEDVDISLH